MTVRRYYVHPSLVTTVDAGDGVSGIYNGKSYFIVREDSPDLKDREGRTGCQWTALVRYEDYEKLAQQNAELKAALEKQKSR